MGKRGKKNLKQKMCEYTYRKKGLGKFAACIRRSLEEVCKTLGGTGYF